MPNQIKKVPERQCVGCRERKPKKELIRVVRLPDENGVEIDLTGKKSGRGAYICPKVDCLKKARKRLEYSLECEIPDDIFKKLEDDIKNG